MTNRYRRATYRFYDLIRKDLIFIVGNYGLRLASFFFTLIVARQISPENYGVYGLASLIIMYISYFNLGSQYSINKELSIDNTNFKVISYGIINSLFFTCLVVIFVVVSTSVGLWKDLHRYTYYLIAYPILFNILEISNGILRAHDKSKYLGYIKLSGTLLVVAITIYYLFVEIPDDPSPLFSRFLIFQIGEVLVSLFFLCKVISFKNLKQNKLIENKYIKFLIIQGIVLSLYITIDSFTKSIDRLFIASFYSATDLGYYTFGVSLQGPFLIAINSIMYMEFSRILKNMKSISKGEFDSSLKMIYRKLFIIWIVTLIGAIILCFPLLKFIIPNYLESYIVVILYLTNYASRILIFPYTSYLIANDFRSDIIKAIIIPNIFNICLSYAMIKLNMPYQFIIVVTIPSNFIYYFILKKVFQRKIRSGDVFSK